MSAFEIAKKILSKNEYYTYEQTPMYGQSGIVYTICKRGECHFVIKIIKLRDNYQQISSFRYEEGISIMTKTINEFAIEIENSIYAGNLNLGPKVYDHFVDYDEMFGFIIMEKIDRVFSSVIVPNMDLPKEYQLQLIKLYDYSKQHLFSHEDLHAGNLAFKNGNIYYIDFEDIIPNADDDKIRMNFINLIREIEMVFKVKLTLLREYLYSN